MAVTVKDIKKLLADAYTLWLNEGYLETNPQAPIRLLRDEIDWFVRNMSDEFDQSPHPFMVDALPLDRVMSEKMEHAYFRLRAAFNACKKCPSEGDQSLCSETIDPYYTTDGSIVVFCDHHVKTTKCPVLGGMTRQYYDEVYSKRK